MSKPIYTLLVATVLITVNRLHAADPEEYLKKKELQYIEQVEKADADLEKAKAKREKKVLDATKEFIEELEKLKVYWTKKGDLEKALAVKKRMDAMEALIASGNSAPIKTLAEKTATAPIDFALTINGAKVKTNKKADISSHTDIRMLDGVSGDLNNYSSYAFPCTHTINLGKLREVAVLRIHLWNHDPRSYRYKVYLSSYGTRWDMLADHSNKLSQGAQEFQLDGKRIQYIKIEGLGNTANSGFHIKEVEALDRMP